MLRKLSIILIIFCVIILGVLLLLRHYYKTGELQEVVLDKIVDQVVGDPKNSSTSTQESVQLIKRLLGFDRPQNYLMLFLNNTELRPGGGFIGTYGVVRVENGVPQVLKVEGTEILDNFAPQDFSSVPPQPIKDYLKVQRWGFRDSNWFPDFASSSNKALELYRKERGLKAGEITTVVGITPTVIEELLRITGPVVVNGEEYTSDNFTEKVEYQVEYGYVQQGIERNERKGVLEDLTHELINRLRSDIFKQWPQYLDLVQRMLQEKQIIMFSLDNDEQKILHTKNWSGEISNSLGDYLLWVDANLGAWKTDASLKRELSYSFISTGTQYIATAKMKYDHQGKIDWRTRNYHTYTRVYVPLGSRLITVSNAVKNITVDQGVENGRQWFGTFTTIPVGASGELFFEYYVSPEVALTIKNGTYLLSVQKQIGTINHGLTLGLDFGRTVVFASPGENPSKYGDTRYDFHTDLRVDREFVVKTERR